MLHFLTHMIVLLATIAKTVKMSSHVGLEGHYMSTLAILHLVKLVFDHIKLSFMVTNTMY